MFLRLNLPKVKRLLIAKKLLCRAGPHRVGSFHPLVYTWELHSPICCPVVFLTSFWDPNSCRYLTDSLSIWSLLSNSEVRAVRRMPMTKRYSVRFIGWLNKLRAHWNQQRTDSVCVLVCVWNPTGCEGRRHTLKRCSSHLPRCMWLWAYTHPPPFFGWHTYKAGVESANWQSESHIWPDGSVHWATKCLKNK